MKANARNTRIISQALHTILYSLVGLAVLSNFGCASMMGIDKTTYQENIGNIKPPAPNHGRLFVYQVESAPQPMTTSVDTKVYRVRAGTYWHVDLPSGKHKVSVGVKLGHPWFSSKKVSCGERAIDFDLKSGDTVYCRVHVNNYNDFTHAAGVGLFAKRDLTLVDAQIATKELAPLHFYIIHTDSLLEKYTITE